MHRQKGSNPHAFAETATSEFTAERSGNHRQVKVITRKPVQVESRQVNATSTKKQRFSSEDFAGFYSPSHHLQKSKIDLNRVLPRTPSNGKNPQCKAAKLGNSSYETPDENASAAMLLAKTPPTRSQLRVRLKLSEISSDAQYFKQQTQRCQVAEPNTQSDQKGSQVAELEKQIAKLTEENSRLRQDNTRQLEVNSKVQQNLEDALHRFTEWQSNELARQELVCKLQSEIAQLKQHNGFLSKNLQSKSEVVNYLHSELEATLRRLREIQSSKELVEFANLELKVGLLQEVARETHEKYHHAYQKARSLQIELRILKQKHKELQGVQSSQEERELLIEKNRRLKREAARLKNQLVEKLQSDELFSLSP